MISIDRFQELADEVADDIPEEFLRKLNGGIILLPQAKRHPDSAPQAPLYIMGEYCSSRMMGRHIIIYYGSFAGTFSHYSEDALKREIRKTIFHEFRHHLESLSGQRDLEIEDAKSLATYKARYGIED